ncbi:MAG: hypothetical protein OXG79_01350 [Chloroflexi bacterium]|nr:hypothetical protein [Chloroflexota bacterium]MCY4111193.1 hypothetical protein [Chloroflexota bacterium]
MAARTSGGTGARRGRPYEATQTSVIPAEAGIHRGLNLLAHA